MEIVATVKGISYRATMCKAFERFPVSLLSQGLEFPVFLCDLGDAQEMAISCWVSPKRTRSYPFSRVYDTLGFTGRKVTVIPIVKDEGHDGDRDYLQWDTVALMGLLGVYVIPAYYLTAEKNEKYQNKITNQKFCVSFVEEQLIKLKFYHSSALHWNLEQLDRLPEIGTLAVNSYKSISSSLNVRLHSTDGMTTRFELATSDRKKFLEECRNRSKAAQLRETGTVQPKEMFDGNKGIITIEDAVGGLYPLTCDHVEITNTNVLKLMESKHAEKKALPALDDIKDGLLKIALFSNLTSAKVGDTAYSCKPVLRLSCGSAETKLSATQANSLHKLQIEAQLNQFELDLISLSSFSISK